MFQRQTPKHMLSKPQFVRQLRSVGRRMAASVHSVRTWPASLTDGGRHAVS